MAKNKTRKIKLRSFLVQSSDITTSSGILLQDLCATLPEKHTIRDRKRQINDVDSEVLSGFSWGPSKRYLFGTLVRIRKDDLRTPLSDQLLDKDTFDIRELSDNYEGETYRDHFYFLTDGRYLVTSLPSTSSQTSRISTYLNWVLADIREDRLYSLQPAVRTPEKLPMKKIKAIEIGNGSSTIRLEQKHSIFNLDMGLLRRLLPSLPGIGDAQEVLDNELIGAKLMLNFNEKPQDMDQDTYQELVGGIAAIGNEELGITVIDKHGRRYTGENVLITKDVEVEVISQLIDEENLKQEMECFLQELTTSIEKE